MSMLSDEPIALADMTLRRATRHEQTAAAFFIGLFALFTFVSSFYAGVQGPVVPTFIPIAATLWGGAELLTAYLLLTQFSVNGVRAFAYVGAAYGISGLLTIPYIVYFPGVFMSSAQGNGMDQVSIWFWLDWHIVSPLVILVYRLYDPHFNRRFLSGVRIRTGIRLVITSVVAGAAVATVLVVVFRNSLPTLVIRGHFTPIWSHALAPLVFVLNAAAAMLVIGLARKPSLFQLWLTVALATSALDGALNAFAGARYTISWYLGKAETLTAACVLLLMLLSQVGALYRRLGTMASVDPLTGLRNRRSFDEYMRWTLARRTSEVAFLLIDIDFFKQYNDRYGHAAGDVCLQRIADVLRASLWRSVDLVARYGGEEFVVLLPETSANGAREVAERIRCGAAALAIAHAGSAVGSVVTLSIGVAHAFRSRATDGDRLFAVADRALYDAKIRRNTTVVADSIGVVVPAVPERDAHTVA